MAKVIVERPRHGSRHDLRRKGRTVSLNVFNELPMRASMSRSFGHRTLNEHLSPLKRWLRAQVGRPWDAVYAELSAHLRPSNAVQQHVRDHVDDFVARHVEEVGGELYVFRFGARLPLLHGRSDVLWVCPRTGLLRRATSARPRYPRRWEPAPPPPPTLLRKLGGCWFELSLAPLPDGVHPPPVWDAALGEWVRRGFWGGLEAEARRRALYGPLDVFTTTTRPLRHAELRRLGLRNESTRRDVRRRRALTG